MTKRSCNKQIETAQMSYDGPNWTEVHWIYDHSTHKFFRLE